MEDLIALVLSLVFALFMLVVAFGVGTYVEKRHYKSIREREAQLRDVLLVPVRTLPGSIGACQTMLVSGSVVIGMDYFKKTLAYLRGLVGGQVGSYETLFERARREAVLRMKQTAKARNAKFIYNVKFSTSNVMSGTSDNKMAGCVEILVYGTAIIPKNN